MLLPRLVLVAAHYLGGRILRGCVQDVHPHLPRLLRKQLPLPNPSKSPSTDSVISAMVLPEITESDRKSTRLNSSHANISYAVFCLKKKKKKKIKHYR